MNESIELSPALACDLSALTADERAQRAALFDGLRAAVTAVEPLADGYALRLPYTPDHFQQAAAYLTLERRCCPFLTLGLAIESDAADMAVQLRGGAGAKEILAEALGL